MRKPIIELEPEEIAACEAWHGGMSSMLYACASTGALSCGSVRPRVRDGRYTILDPRSHYRPMTDLEWQRDLVERLESEAGSDAVSARERAEDPADEYDDPDELIEQAEALEAIAIKCRAWLDANPEVQS